MPRCYRAGGEARRGDIVSVGPITLAELDAGEPPLTKGRFGEVVFTSPAVGWHKDRAIVRWERLDSNTTEECRRYLAYVPPASSEIDLEKLYLIWRPRSEHPESAGDWLRYRADLRRRLQLKEEQLKAEVEEREKDRIANERWCADQKAKREREEAEAEARRAEQKREYDVWYNSPEQVRVRAAQYERESATRDQKARDAIAQYESDRLDWGWATGKSPAPRRPRWAYRHLNRPED